jgi:DNA-binding transcriptional LysR family regulator
MATPQESMLRGFASGHLVGSRALAILLAFSEGGGIRAAARLLGLTPAAVRKAVRQIEDRFGSEMFARRREGLMATETGQRLN